MMRHISAYVDYEAYAEGSEDAHGNESETWLPAVKLGIYAYNPGTTDEPFVPGHDRVITNPTLYLPSGILLTPRGRITVGTEVLQIDGDTQPYRNPYDSSMNGNVVNLKKVSG